MCIIYRNKFHILLLESRILCRIRLRDWTKFDNIIRQTITNFSISRNYQSLPYKTKYCGLSVAQRKLRGLNGTPRSRLGDAAEFGNASSFFLQHVTNGMSAPCTVSRKSRFLARHGLLVTAAVATSQSTKFIDTYT